MDTPAAGRASRQADTVVKQDIGEWIKLHLNTLPKCYKWKAFKSDYSKVDVKVEAIWIYIWIFPGALISFYGIDLTYRPGSKLSRAPQFLRQWQADDSFKFVAKYHRRQIFSAYLHITTWNVEHTGRIWWAGEETCRHGAKLVNHENSLFAGRLSIAANRWNAGDDDNRYTKFACTTDASQESTLNNMFRRRPV